MALDPDRRFQLVGILGKGAYGQVLRVIDTRLQEEVAIKRIKLTGLDAQKVATLRKYLNSELTNHRRLVHPNVCLLREVFLFGNHLCIVMDLANAGSLFAHVNDSMTVFGRMSENRARWFFQQLVATMDYLHKKGIYHRDLKLENVLLQVEPRLLRPRLKLCDFGLSKHQQNASSRVGTIQYYSPEVLVGQAYESSKVDIWCSGVMLYTMLTGHYPFWGGHNNNAAATAHQVQNTLNDMRTRNYMQLPSLSTGARTLLSRLLDPNMTTRITIDQIRQDPWFAVDLAANPCADFDANLQHLQRQPVCTQSDQELQLLVHRALHIVGGAPHGNGFPPGAISADIDHWIDQTMGPVPAQ